MTKDDKIFLAKLMDNINKITKKDDIKAKSFMDDFNKLFDSFKKGGK